MPGNSVEIRSPAIFRRLVVLLDRPDPARGAFAHALDWACQLKLPLHGIIFQATKGETAQGPGDQKALQGAAAPHQPLTGVANPEGMAACAACGQRGVPWETGSLEDRLFEPGTLVMLGSALPEAQRKVFLSQKLRDSGVAVLLCPDIARPCTRVLLLNDDSATREGFLTTGVALCRDLGAWPVVLTVARSERRARQRQQAAQEVLAGSGLGCDFDLIIGAEIRVAVGQVARWRRCQVIAMEHRSDPPWWRWWHGETAEKLMGLADTFALLTIPGAGALDPTPNPRRTPPASRDVFPTRAFH
jgi:hypothetical protein